MSQHLLDADEVVSLLAQEVESVGGQSEWARRTGVDRSILNRILRRRRPLTESVVKALGLKTVVLPSRADIVRRLSEEVERAGSQSEYARRTGLDRTYITHVLNGRAPGRDVIKALNLTRIIRYAPKKRTIAKPV